MRPGRVDDSVQTAQVGDRLADDAADRAEVLQVEPVRRLADLARTGPMGHGHPRPALQQQLGHGTTDAARASDHQRTARQPGQVRRRARRTHADAENVVVCQPVAPSGSTSRSTPV
ncbi:MAG TPA: hypothetical protein VD859_14485 [Nocardioides sp.]|nr:hypothetical protein [Nocardioides sp.]